ncbi:hypothetical protein M951_chr3101 (nucleomorph) [Lotharella oceanica]|uniref:Uncharacterized protein n=1 Tax=Lotharella oceanica TaxID=641309 RepID=A0A060DBY6_9EUKA|nr:hypothetical protein M951_chr3101 [Lotharella oceanica]
MLRKVLIFLYLKNFKILFLSKILNSIQYINIKKYIIFLIFIFLNIVSLKTNYNTVFLFYNTFIRNKILTILLKFYFFIKNFNLIKNSDIYAYIDVYAISKKLKNFDKIIIHKCNYFIKLKYNFRFVKLEKFFNIERKTVIQFCIHARYAEFLSFNKHLYSIFIHQLAKMSLVTNMLYLFF